MSNSNDDSDWSGSRGRQWLANVTKMEAMLRPVDKPLFDALDLGAGQRVAEIGCGGGGTARSLAAQAGGDIKVHGIDVSPDLIAEASAQSSGLPNLSFSAADAGEQRLTSPVYDRLTSRFGIMFFADPAQAFMNLATWLKPGGRFAFAVWGPPPMNPWMLAVRDSVATVLDLPSADPEAPGPFRYANADKLMDLLSAAGLTELTANPWQGSLALGGGLAPADAAAFGLSAFAFAEPLKATPELYHEAQVHLTEALSEFVEQGVVSMPAFVHIVSGCKTGAANE